jgi:hypothetical protein
MAQVREGENMNWKFWQNWSVPRWFKTRQQLINENEELYRGLENAAHIVNAIHTTLKHTILDSERAIQNLRIEAIELLGGVALQCQGEICVKNEFIEMVTLPEYNLQISVKRDKEKNCTIISAIESPKEPEANVEN